MGYGTRLAASMAAVAALAAGCGSRAEIGDRERTFAPTGTPTASATASGGTSTPTATSQPSGPAATASGTASAVASVGPMPKSSDRFCDFPATVRCTKDAAVARDWWLPGAMLEGPAGMAFTYVLRSPRGFGPDVEPRQGDGSAFNIVVHERGGDPATTKISELMPKGALLISGVPVESNRTVPPNAGKPVTVRGQKGFMVTTPEKDGRPATRIIGWYETVRGQRILWTAISAVRTWKTDDEVLRLVNGLRRT